MRVSPVSAPSSHVFERIVKSATASKKAPAALFVRAWVTMTTSRNCRSPLRTDPMKLRVPPRATLRRSASRSAAGSDTRPRLLGLGPPHPPAEHLLEAAVGLGEAGSEPGPGLGRHPPHRPRIVGLEGGGMVRPGQAQELEHACVAGGRVGEELLRVDDQHLLRVEPRSPRLELIGVLAPGHVGVVLERRALVLRVGEHSLTLAGEPVRLELERPLERPGVLEAARVLLLVLRVRAVYRV